MKKNIIINKRVRESSGKKIESRQINCPVCDSSEYEKIYKNEYRLHGEGGALVWPAQQVVCKKCGMVFTNPQPTNKTLERFYESDVIFGKTFRYSEEKQLEFISKNVSSDCRSVFDIGAYNGVFLSAAEKMGYEVFGIEPSKAGIQEAKDKYGITLNEGFFGENFLKYFSEKFDIVTISNVLEHVPDPLGFLRTALKVTNPNKYIYIDVPDTSRPFAENVADFFSNQHLTHFTESSLKNIVTVLGIKTVMIEKDKQAPIIRMLLKNESQIKKGQMIGEYERNKKIMMRYKSRREKFITSLRAKIEQGAKKIILYGAGMHTAQLFQSGLIDNIEIDCIVDSNPRKWGTAFEGYNVGNPKILKEKKSPVLISSYYGQEEIAGYLKDNFPHLSQIKLYSGFFY